MVVLLPFLVYADIMFRGYTITFDPVAVTAKTLGRSMPVADPYAGSNQDHPWLTYIGRSLRQGEIPLVNLQNGLGAPLLESLQPGVLYPPNILLPLFNLDRPWFFGAFMVLHVMVLGLTSAMLFQLYLPAAPARVLALAFTLSPMTFSAINMVHFRAFVWVPAMAWMAVKLARGEARPVVVLIGSAATAVSLSAGNPQETLFGLLASGAIFCFELVHRGRHRLRAALLCAASLVGGALATASSLAPYVQGMRDGVLASSMIGVPRYMQGNQWQWIPAWIVPAYQGVPPHLLQQAKHYDEWATFSFAPAAFFLVLAGLAANSRTASRMPKGNLWIFGGLLTVAVLGVMKVFGLPILDAIVSHLPVFNAVRYTKYVNYIHLLAAIAAAMALAHLIQLPLSERKTAVCASVATFGLLVLLAIGLAAVTPHWAPTRDGIKVALWIWLGGALSVVAPAWALTRVAKIPWLAVAVSIAVAALLMRPYGFHKAVERYAELVPAPEWNEERSAGRILALELPNANLLRGYESLGVFDPIQNARFAHFMRSNFEVVNDDLVPQPMLGLEISPSQVDVLRLMGVTSIVGYKVGAGAVTKMAEGWWGVQRPLPRVFLIPEVVERQADDACLSGDYGYAVEVIEQALLAAPIAVKKGANHLEFALRGGGKGTLVALQAFTPAWQLEGRTPRLFCGLFPAWSGEYEHDKSYTIRYRPPGLTGGLVLALVGVLLVTGACVYAARRGPLRFEVERR